MIHTKSERKKPKYDNNVTLKHTVINVPNS